MILRTQKEKKGENLEKKENQNELNLEDLYFDGRKNNIL